MAESVSRHKREAKVNGTLARSGTGEELDPEGGAGRAVQRTGDGPVAAGLECRSLEHREVLQAVGPAIQVKRIIRGDTVGTQVDGHAAVAEDGVFLDAVAPKVGRGGHVHGNGGVPVEGDGIAEDGVVAGALGPVELGQEDAVREAYPRGIAQTAIELRIGADEIIGNDVVVRVAEEENAVEAIGTADVALLGAQAPDEVTAGIL